MGHMFGRRLMPKLMPSKSTVDVTVRARMSLLGITAGAVIS
jgi:hypothetical protein